MRRAALSLAASLLIASTVASQENGKTVHEVFTLDSSLERATKNNPQILESQRNLALAKISTREAKALFYPKINLNLNYVRYKNETLGITSPEMGNIILEAPIEGPNGERGNPLAENLFLGRIGFVQTLFAGGRLNYTYKLSKANVSQAETDNVELMRKVQYDTTRSYVALLALREKKALLEAAAAEMGRWETGGHGGLLVQQARRDIREKLANNEKETQDAMYDFLGVMGLELFSEVEVAGTLDTQPLQLDLKTVLVWAKQNRSELKQTQLQAEVDQLAVNLALAERYPVFLLGGGVEMRDSETPIEETNWNTALTMNIPLFDGISIPTRIKESRHRAERGRLRRVQLEDRVEREVRSSFYDYGHWKEELTLRTEDAKKLERQKSSYQRAGFRERIEYMEWSLRAKDDIIDAKSALFLSKASLERATGRPLNNTGLI